jgi:hypothetical protein
MRYILISTLTALTIQAVLPAGLVAAQREDALATAATVPDMPPNSELLRDWGDLLSRGGCSTPSNKLRLRMEEKYGARLVVIRERILLKYGSDRSNHDVVTVGSCMKHWQQYRAEQKVELGIRFWEACLGIEAAARPVSCPN